MAASPVLGELARARRFLGRSAGRFRHRCSRRYARRHYDRSTRQADYVATNRRERQRTVSAPPGKFDRDFAPTCGARAFRRIVRRNRQLLQRPRAPAPRSTSWANRARTERVIKKGCRYRQPFPFVYTVGYIFTVALMNRLNGFAWPPYACWNTVPNVGEYGYRNACCTTFPGL